MNEAIELHDSELVAVSFSDGEAVVSFSAYIHRSTGTPGVDAGSGWSQPATLAIASASMSSVVELPLSVADGSLRIGDALHDNCIPSNGTFDGPIELHLHFHLSESLTIRGERLTIALHGEPSYVEDFKP